MGSLSSGPEFWARPSILSLRPCAETPGFHATTRRRPAQTASTPITQYMQALSRKTHRKSKAPWRFGCLACFQHAPCVSLLASDISMTYRGLTHLPIVPTYTLPRLQLAPHIRRCPVPSHQCRDQLHRCGSRKKFPSRSWTRKWQLVRLGHSQHPPEHVSTRARAPTYRRGFYV